MDTKRTLSAKELLQWNSKSNANQRINEVQAVFCEILEKMRKKNKRPEVGQLTAVFLRSWPPLGQNRVLLRFYVTVSCEILTRSQHQNLFKPYKNMVNKRSSVLVKVRESTTIEWNVSRGIILIITVLTNFIIPIRNGSYSNILSTRLKTSFRHINRNRS